MDEERQKRRGAEKGATIVGFTSHFGDTRSYPVYGSLLQAIKAANQASGWVSPGQLTSSQRIFGYQDMKIEDYDYKGDWNYP